MDTVTYARPEIAAYPPSVVAIKGHPVHAMLDHFPIVCFLLTLLTDIAYWRSSNLMWQHFSEWLLFVGVSLGGLAFILVLIDVAFRPALRATRLAWPYIIGVVVTLVLAMLNNFVHATDGWVGVVPWGLTLSVLTVIAVLVTAWFGREMTYRAVRGVSYDV